MAQTCTAPDRWAKTPGSDASDTEVDLFLEHVLACPFHRAQVERDHRRLDALITEVRESRHGAHPPSSTGTRRSGQRQSTSGSRARHFESDQATGIDDRSGSVGSRPGLPAMSARAT